PSPRAAPLPYTTLFRSLDGAHSGGGAGQDDVTGQQGDHAGDLGDQLGDRADHVGGRAGLSDLSVDARADGCGRRTQIGLDPGADRTGGVEGLGAEPLVLLALGVAGGEVVGAGVAEDHVARLLRLDVL